MHEIELPTDFYEFMSIRICKGYGGCSFAEKANLRYLIQRKLKQPYFVCELRPMLNYVFAEYLADYDYAGWSDLDTVWGDVDILKPWLKYDVITVAHYDLHRLYLRGQFSLFKNTLELSLTYTIAMPKPKLFEILNSNMNYAEEGLYSKFMVSSNYSVLVLPYQGASWGDVDCRENVTMKNGKLECDLVDSVPLIHDIRLSQTYSLEIPNSNSKTCDIFWVAADYRTCLDTAPFGIQIIYNNTVKIYPLTLDEKRSVLRYPLFFHFQAEKNNFNFKES